MTVGLRNLTLISALSVVSLSACGAAESKAEPPPLVLERTIPLKGVKGRIDHLAVDLKRGRLFVAELGNGTAEAVDLAPGGASIKISGLKEPQGLAYLPGSDQLAVASGGDGTVRFYSGADLAPLSELRIGDDADNLRVVPGSGDLLAGYGAGALAVIDPQTHKVTRTLALPAHPEGFQIDGARVFVNVPDAGAIIGANLTTGAITATWKAAHRWNFPMAYDHARGVIAVVYRFPSRLVILDAISGKPKADLSTCGDADDVFIDARRQRFYVSCGSGTVDVVQATDYRALARIPTRAGARTALFVPELDRLFVAARAEANGGEAAILVYRPQP